MKVSAILNHIWAVWVLPEECQLKLEAICLPSLHALCVICYILGNASPQIKLQTVSLDTTQKELWNEIVKGPNKAVDK